MEDINLHFTGDIHAMTAANNLLCAVIDNSIYQGNPLPENPKKGVFQRAVDQERPAPRLFIRIGLGSRFDGVPRDDGFMITVASEVMAILCLASGIDDLKQRLGSILVGYTFDDKPVFCRDPRRAGRARGPAQGRDQAQPSCRPLRVRPASCTADRSPISPTGATLSWP